MHFNPDVLINSFQFLYLPFIFFLYYAGQALILEQHAAVLTFVAQ